MPLRYNILHCSVHIACERFVYTVHKLYDIVFLIFYGSWYNILCYTRDLRFLTDYRIGHFFLQEKRRKNYCIIHCLFCWISLNFHKAHFFLKFYIKINIFLFLLPWIFITRNFECSYWKSTILYILPLILIEEYLSVY